MARSRGNGGNDKYLRLTGLWESKNNDGLFTGRAKTEQIEALLKQCEEALDADAPLVFSLWENTKKKSRKDPEFSIQSFVGDAEEKPRSRRSSRDNDREESREDSRDRKRRPSRDDNESDDDENDEDQTSDDTDNVEDEPEDEPRKRTGKVEEKPKKKRASW